MTESNAEPQEDSGCIDYKDEETLRRLHWDEGLSLGDMAERLGCGKTTVHRWMGRLDVDRRDHKSAVVNEFRKEYARYRVTQDGYCIWQSFHNGGTDRMQVHRLLAVAEYGIDAVKGRVVHHEDGVKWNNVPGNISLMDNSEHTKHHAPIGEDHHNSKLTSDEVVEIKQLLDETDMYQEDIAEMYGVSQVHISKIHLGEKWNHLEP